jgi:hypothetical protein
LTKRPWSVKQRIMSRTGHLSNAAAANVVVELLEGRLQRAVLGHLSGTAILRTWRLRRCGRGWMRSARARVEVVCAGQREISARLL